MCPNPVSNLSSGVQVGGRVKEWRPWRRKTWDGAERPKQAAVISSWWFYPTTHLAADWRLRTEVLIPVRRCWVLRRACMCRLRCSLVLVRLGRFISRKRLFPLHLIRRSRCVGIPRVSLVRVLSYVVNVTVTWAEYYSKRSFGLHIIRSCVIVHFTSLTINSHKGSLITQTLFNGSRRFFSISDGQPSVSSYNQNN